MDEFGFFLWHALDLEVAGGRVFAVGQDVGHGTWLVRALELNSGDVIWQREFEPDVSGAEYGWTQAVAVDGGRLFVAGSVANATGNSDALVRALDAR
ncbi:MAG TPA: PQQ-binding-like beta-propeller repeat protein [Ktedonobacterales bacterium]|nr:PQQ-binding-like beta-propeller repeat protein [Ktedonobacterales bacterium]